MALFRFEAKIISRNGGRTSAVGSAAYQSGKCATSAAAYRAGAEMVDERTGQHFNYTNKSGVLGAEIMLPDGAPAWMQNRSQLWNAVEAIEKRKDAQLARDFIVSLPHELSDPQRRELLREFVEKHLTSRGYVADCAYHAPPKGEGMNWHAHVMVPMRKVTADGFAPRKERPEGNPNAAWRAELATFREDWAAHVNRHLEAAGIEARVDHRSNADQGIEREPEPKLGPIAAKIEAEGRDSHAGTDLRDVRARNAERNQLRRELLGITADIINLDAERAKRMATDQVDPRVYAEQPEKIAAKAQEIDARINRPREEDRLAEQLIKNFQKDQAEAVRHQESVRRKREAEEANQDIRSAGFRHAEAMGRAGGGNWVSQCVNTANAEYALFAKEQEAMRQQIADAKTAEEKRTIELKMQIEGADYMRITSTRLAGMSDAIAGKQHSEQGDKDRERAEFWKERSDQLKQERAELIRAEKEAGLARAKDNVRDRDDAPASARLRGRDDYAHSSPDRANVQRDEETRETRNVRERAAGDSGGASRPDNERSRDQGNRPDDPGERAKRRTDFGPREKEGGATERSGGRGRER